MRLRALSVVESPSRGVARVGPRSAFSGARCPLSIEQTGSVGAAARTYRVIEEDVDAYPYTVGLRGCSAIDVQLLVVLVGLVSNDKLNR